MPGLLFCSSCLKAHYLFGALNVTIHSHSTMLALTGLRDALSMRKETGKVHIGICM